MRQNIFLICIISILIFSSCTTSDYPNKWERTKLSKIVKKELNDTITKNHDKAVYGIWHLSTDQNITLKFSSESIWQYSQKTTDNIGCTFISGNNFTMSNNTLCLYKKSGEIITGKYKLNDPNNLTITDFNDNKFNGTWTKK